LNTPRIVGADNIIKLNKDMLAPTFAYVLAIHDVIFGYSVTTFTLYSIWIFWLRKIHSKPEVLAVTIRQLTHHALVGLPQCFMQGKAAHAFINKIRD
jgi:hypothetical protein